jgi:hypothetical protein
MIEGIITRYHCCTGFRRYLAATAVQRLVGRLSEQAVVKLHSIPCHSDPSMLRHSGVLSVVGKGGKGLPFVLRRY